MDETSNFRVGSKADLSVPNPDFRFSPESRHQAHIAEGPVRAVNGPQPAGAAWLHPEPSGLHLRLSFPVALTTFRRELACISPRSFDGLELACSAQEGERTLSNGIKISAILPCGLGSTFKAEVTHIPFG